MTKQRKRNCLLKFYVSEEEKAFIFKKMKIAKIKNLSAYLRKAAIDEKIEMKLTITCVKSELISIKSLKESMKQIRFISPIWRIFKER